LPLGASNGRRRAPPNDRFPTVAQRVFRRFVRSFSFVHFKRLLRGAASGPASNIKDDAKRRRSG